MSTDKSSDSVDIHGWRPSRAAARTAGPAARLLASAIAVCGFTVPASAAGSDDVGAPPPRENPFVRRAFDPVCDGQWIGNAICYGPHRDGQHPGGPGPTRAQLLEDLRLMRPHWRLLRMYATGDEAETVLELIHAEKLGMKVMLGVWITPETSAAGGAPDAGARAANQAQIREAVRLANAYPELVLAVSIGNETQVSWSAHRVDPVRLIDALRRVRAGVACPVTTADDFSFWSRPASRVLASEVDFIGLHVHPLWCGRALDDAVAFVREKHREVARAHPDVPVVLCETGWATRRHNEGEQARLIRGAVGEAEQARFHRDFLGWTTPARLPNFFFEAFDEKWKGGAHPDEVEKHWGLFRSDRTPKQALRAAPPVPTAPATAPATPTTRPRPAAAPAADVAAGDVPDTWRRRVWSIHWVCYTPTNADPDRGTQPPPESISADLAALRAAGFTGLVTYGCTGLSGRPLVEAAERHNFAGLILGIWDPTSAEEMRTARDVAHRDIILGFCIGNEGYKRRYTPEQLAQAIAALRAASKKPVTTTEEFDDYVDPAIAALGDWVFPNAHPYLHGRRDAAASVRWTIGAYDELLLRSGRFIWFKEVGLPTAGDAHGRAAPEVQAEYYWMLAGTGVVFAYFESFDHPWKTWQPYESHWGLFTAQRSPKVLAAEMLAGGPPARPTRWRSAETLVPPALATPPPSTPFVVYRDAASSENHFAPTGYDGDCGDIAVDTAWRENPHAGDTCLRIVYTTTGAGPTRCAYGPPCRWASLRWQHPPDNWGDREERRGAGFDLTGYRRLRFWARADSPCAMLFYVGGTEAPHGDSLAYRRSVVAALDRHWQQYEIDLRGADLTHIIAGFGWSTSWDLNPDGATFYLDDVQFE